MKISGATYLRWCLSLTFGAMMGVAALNYWADPCGIYHYNKPWDWVHSRPVIFETEFVHKAWALPQAQVGVVLLGSSRTDEGLDPHNPALPAAAYNLGLSHGTIYEAWRYLQDAAAAHPLQTVVVGIDMSWFAAQAAPTQSFSDDRLLVQPDGQPTPTWTHALADLSSTLFSLSTAQFSLETLFAPTASRLAFDGGYEANAPQMVEHMDLARNVLAANAKWIITPDSYRGPDGRCPQMDAFEHIVGFCADKKIHLIVFVHPLHAAMVDKYTANWPRYSDWMKAVAARMTDPDLHGELWDFSSYNAMNTEPFPLPTDKYSHMQYYWEGSHYRKIVGDMVLRKIFTGEGPSSFGHLVTTATVDQDLQRLQAEKQAWHDHGVAVAVTNSGVIRVGHN